MKNKIKILFDGLNFTFVFAIFGIVHTLGGNITFNLCAVLLLTLIIQIIDFIHQYFYQISSRNIILEVIICLFIIQFIFEILTTRSGEIEGALSKVGIFFCLNMMIFLRFRTLIGKFINL